MCSCWRKAPAAAFLLPCCPLAPQSCPAGTGRASFLLPALPCGGLPPCKQLSSCCGEKPAAAESWQQSDCCDGWSWGERCRRFRSHSTSGAHSNTELNTNKQTKKGWDKCSFLQRCMNISFRDGHPRVQLAGFGPQLVTGMNFPQGKVRASPVPSPPCLQLTQLPDLPPMGASSRTASKDAQEQSRCFRTALPAPLGPM